jgi:hypothetical protein
MPGEIKIGCNTVISIKKAYLCTGSQGLQENDFPIL